MCGWRRRNLCPLKLRISVDKIKRNLCPLNFRISVDKIRRNFCPLKLRISVDKPDGVHLVPMENEVMFREMFGCRAEDHRDTMTSKTTAAAHVVCMAERVSVQFRNSSTMSFAKSSRSACSTGINGRASRRVVRCSRTGWLRSRWMVVRCVMHMGSVIRMLRCRVLLAEF